MACMESRWLVPLALALAIGCAGGPPPQVASGKTLEVVLEDLPEWPASRTSLATAQAVLWSVLRRLEIETPHLQALSAEGLLSPDGEYQITDHRMSTLLDEFIFWEARWWLREDGSVREARTEVTLFAASRQILSVRISIASRHPKGAALAYPGVLLESLQRALAEELPKALKAAGLRASVRFVDPEPGK